jgi:hypothetical protein
MAIPQVFLTRFDELVRIVNGCVNATPIAEFTKTESENITDNLSERAISKSTPNWGGRTNELERFYIPSSCPPPLVSCAVHS